jgi:hypothetical protein
MKTSKSAAGEDVRPPLWAETILRLVLKPEDRESVPGDLLEEYREVIQPSCGSRAADLWYIRQVGGFLWRATWIWALFFSGAFIARTAFDWLVPTHDFHARSNMSTAVGVALLFSAGFAAAWRSRSVMAGPLAAVVTSQIAAIISVVGAATLLGICHDPQTRRAIIASGGLEEVFELPFLMAIPAVFLGTIGGVAGRLMRGISRRSS